MPFIRHTRDKRGYETTYVMHAYRPAQGPQRTRVLYLFRSPSHVKIGRYALDEEIQEALEHTHPDVSFDWSALGRESAVVRDQARDRAHERDRSPGPRHSRPAPAPPRNAEPVRATVEAAVDDQSLLGRVAGAERAAKLRAQYAELLQRIARRSRTPEDRNRLSQQAQRLNPDDWSDEADIRARLDHVQVEWEAVAVELPARRRGRRGGRRREREGPTAGSGEAGTGVFDEGPSGIMIDEAHVDSQTDTVEMDRPDSGADAHRDDGGGGAEGQDPVEPAGDGISGDD